MMLFIAFDQNGLPTAMFDEVIGKRVLRDVEYADAVKKSDIE